MDDQPPGQDADQRRRDYDEHGFVTIGPVLPSNTAQRLRDAFYDFVESQPPSPPTGYGIIRHNVWEQIDGFRELKRPPA